MTMGAAFLVVDPLRYFPTTLRRRYNEFIPGHRLSRQILATLVANDLINRMGPSFVKRVQDDTGAKIVTIARAYTIARLICRAGSLNKTIEALDNKIPAEAQMSMMFEVSRTLRHACYWLIDRFGDGLQIEKSVDRLKDRLTSVYSRPSATMSPNARLRHEKAAAEYMEMGVSEQLANRMASLQLTRVALDIADLSFVCKRDVGETAKLYAAFNHALGMFWLHAGAEDLQVSGRWQAMARSNLREEFYRLRREMAEPILASRSKKPVPERLDKWLVDNHEEITRFRAMVDEIKLRSSFDFATLSVAAQELRELISGKS